MRRADDDTGDAVEIPAPAVFPESAGATDVSSGANAPLMICEFFECFAPFEGSEYSKET